MTCSCDAMLDEDAYGWVYESKCKLNTYAVTPLFRHGRWRACSGPFQAAQKGSPSSPWAVERVGSFGSPKEVDGGELRLAGVLPSLRSG